jgi:nitrogen fixation protein NifB
MTNLSNHPCFDGKAKHLFGRIHLPVAPRCNMQCNFCNRKYDCVNESHPGVTSAILTPSEALAYLSDTISQRPEITVAGLAGPGDPFANPEETMQTMRLIRQAFPELLLCVATNGFALDAHIEELAELQVRHVTITVNAIDPKTGAKIYAWMRDGKRIVRGEAAAALLWERQEHAIRKLKAHGIFVKINSIIIPGINDRHIPDIAKTMAALGADVLNCMPMAPVRGSFFENLPEPDAGTIERIRQRAGESLPQMNHCTRCRADAVGLLSESPLQPAAGLTHWIQRNQNTNVEPSRPFVAVASYEGVLVNQHLGEAERLMIYGRCEANDGSFELKELRWAPPRGGGEDRWVALAEILSDCRAFLVASAGPNPQKALSRRGLKLVEMEGLIEEGLEAVYANRSVPPVMKRQFMGCSQGAGCRGTGTGCG